jgi:SPP1 gp7 family putative phage head morphogenesis protein
VILKGIDNGETVPQIGKQLRDFYSDRSAYKAMRVARTEVTQSASFGSLEAAKQTGAVKTKTWLSSRDDRVRDAHAMMDGETVDIDGTFSNGCSAPGIGGDAAETIQCRCVLMYGTR